MILLVHMLFGAAIGSAVNNIPLAIILALLGHYFLDIFPHVEYLTGTEESVKKLRKGDWKEYAPDMVKVFLDFCLGLLLIFLFSKNYPLIYICAFFAIVPDGITIINSLFPNKILQKHQEIHSGKIHYLTKQKKFPLFWRIATQVATVVISIVVLAA